MQYALRSNQSVVPYGFKLRNVPASGFLFNAFDKFASCGFIKGRRAQVFPPLLLARTQMRKVMGNSSLSATKMVSHVSAHN